MHHAKLKQKKTHAGIRTWGEAQRGRCSNQLGQGSFEVNMQDHMLFNRGTARKKLLIICSLVYVILFKTSIFQRPEGV